MLLTLPLLTAFNQENALQGLEGTMGRRDHSEGVNRRRNRNGKSNHRYKEMGEIRDHSGKRSIITNPHTLGDPQLKPDLSNQQSGRTVEVVMVLKFILCTFAL